MLRWIHGADFHLDSPFRALTPQQAAERRQESRARFRRLADYVNRRGIRLVLLAGDLFDSANPFRETGEMMAETLGRMEAAVCIAPGNHDWYGSGSPWTEVAWPGNVHVFRENRMTSLELGEVVIHGAAFTGPQQTESLLRGFTAPRDGRIHIGVLHGEMDPASPYNPLTREEIAGSGLTYLALGHVHKRTELLTLGETACAWPGCPEGRGFDETGQKGFYEGRLEHGQVSLDFVPFGRRRYEVVTVDVTDRSPLAAVEDALPAETEPHLYRILLTGEAEGVDCEALRAALAPRFYALDVRDQTRVREDVWARCGEDSLRGLFLRNLREQYEAAETEDARATVQRAARFGLAALEHRELG